MAQLTGKLMEQKLKYGWTLSDVAQYLNCSEDEAKEKIKKEFSSKAAHGMLVRMEKNSKQRTRQLTSRGKAAYRTASKINHITEQVPELTPEEGLKQKEDSITKCIIDAESKYKEALANKKNLKKTLSDEKAELLKIHQQVNAKKQKVSDIISKIISLDSQMSKAFNEITVQKEALSNVQAELRELNKLTIFVFDTGDIEAENYIIDDLDFQSKYNDITSNYADSVEDLTLKQIKQLAKLLVFIETLTDRAFEIVFDSETFQTAYKALIS